MSEFCVVVGMTNLEICSQRSDDIPLRNVKVFTDLDKQKYCLVKNSSKPNSSKQRDQACLVTLLLVWGFSQSP